MKTDPLAMQPPEILAKLVQLEDEDEAEHREMMRLHAMLVTWVGEAQATEMELAAGVAWSAV